MRKPDDLSSRKRDLRDRLKSRRSALAEDEIVASSRRINERLVALLGDAHRVGLYVPQDGEVRLVPEALVSARRGDSFVFAWPIADRVGHTLEFHASSETPTTPGAYGIPEPEPEPRSRVAPTCFDAILVPGLAFSSIGERLGFGLGYYDRFLRRLRPDALRIGVCYAWQIIDSLPVEPHDVPMTHIVTEDDTIVAPDGADDLYTGIT